MGPISYQLLLTLVDGGGGYILNPLLGGLQTYSKRNFTKKKKSFYEEITAVHLGWIPGSGRSAGEGIGYPLQYSWASLVAKTVKNPP